MIKVGSKVLTQYSFDGERRDGTVTEIDGAYVMVYLDALGYLIEAYDTELEEI